MIRKTAAITAASIVGVVLAGGAAVGANIGILNAADGNSLGNLSVEAPITMPLADLSREVELVSSAKPPGVVNAASSANAMATVDSTISQIYTVDVAGTVEVEVVAAGLQLGEVEANQGWSVTVSNNSNTLVSVTFTSATEVLEFTASLNADGSINPAIGRPVASPAVTTPHPSGGYDDEHHGREDEDEDEDEDHDDKHHGRDDDD